MSRSTAIVLGFVAFALLVLAVSCNRPENEAVLDRAQETFRDADWYDHVEEWSPGGATMRIRTDYAVSDPATYRQALTICRAVTGLFAKDADDVPRVVVSGRSVETRTKIDGTTETEVDDDVDVVTYGARDDRECRADPADDLRDRVEELGVPLG